MGAHMSNRYRSDARFVVRMGLGFVFLLLVLILPILLPIRARAQTASTPTATVRIPNLFRPPVTLIAPPIVITKSAPTFVAINVGVLNLESFPLTSKTTVTTADLNYEDQFKATVNVQSPSSMLLGESRVITLELVPELLAQASMVRADLRAIKFESLDDGQPEKTVIENIPVRWNWNIAPKEVGEQEFFLSISYVNNQGSRVNWQNITLQMSVAQPVTPTRPPTATATDTQAPAPFNTEAPTLTASPTSSPPFYTLTPTRTFMEKVSDDVADNPAPYLGTLVTLMLGLLGVYFQYVRKNEKDSGKKK